MSFNQDFKEYLLSNIPGAKLASGGKEILCRCHMCGDSRKDANDRHLYISLGDNNHIPQYNCFLCNRGGNVTTKFLRSLELYDANIAMGLNKELSNYYNTPGNILVGSNKTLNLKNNLIANNKLSYIKLKYINDRLKTNLSFNDLKYYKIVLNINDILYENNITSYTRNERVIDQLNDNFLGFISGDNSYIVMRNLNLTSVHSSVDERYVNYKMSNNVDGSKSYYIPTEVSKISIHPTKIYISEGVFDILSIYFNIVQDKTNSIFAAINGKSYLNTINNIVMNTGLLNIELHIFVDKDIKDRDLYDIFYYYSNIGINVIIYRNIYPNEKDFGVSIDRILIEKYTIVNGRITKI